VSILTASLLDPGRERYLVELHAQLAASAVDWEWIIVIDGAHARTLPEPLTRDPRVRVLRAGRPIGAAAARNLGLGLARGDYVTSVDDDDRSAPGSLESRLAAVTDYGLAWAGGLLADLRDGVLDAWNCPMPRGLAPPGAVWRAWGCPCLPFPIGPTTLLVDTELLRRVGGWHGLPQAEDFGMTLAVTGRAPGLVLDRVVYVYRRHASQMTTRRDFEDLEPLVRHITFERGRLEAAASAAVRLPSPVAVAAAADATDEGGCSERP
jgi:hypothetical protein